MWDLKPLSRFSAPQFKRYQVNVNEQEYIQSWVERNLKREDQELDIGELTISVRRAVFSPDPALTNSTTQAIKHLPAVIGKRVLDLGTGSGVLAFHAAHCGAREVVAVDIDPLAVANARENCCRLKFERVVSVVQGDLFETLSGEFDVIVANLPILDSVWKGLNISVKETFSKFFRGLDAHLSPSGTALFIFAPFGDRAALDLVLKECTRSWIVHEEEKFGVIGCRLELTTSFRPKSLSLHEPRYPLLTAPNPFLS